MSTETLLPAGEAIGLDLGTRAIDYTESDAILYALAVGATAGELDLVFERNLSVLPTFALPHGLWACESLRGRGFFSSANALHGSQSFEVLRPLPGVGRFDLQARVAAVWDKGTAAVFEVEVACDLWRATYSIFAPGCGGWGGERGPSPRRAPDRPPARWLRARTHPDQAALYRLTGDRHLIHIDPMAARAIGQPRPILHGLCTLGVTARVLPGLLGHHPRELTSLQARFTSVVFPGDELEIRTWESLPDGTTPFAVGAAGSIVLDGGLVAFG